MANTVISLKKSPTPSAVPSDLSNGELALNYSDGKLFYKHANGTILSISSSGAASFGTINANNSLVVADAPGSILTLVPGTNITIVGNTITDTITISANVAGGGDPTNAYNQANAAYAQANLVFGSTNTAQFTAVAAFGQANTATTNASNAFGAANTAQSTSVSAFGAANTAGTNAINAYGQANTALTTAQAAYGQANSAAGFPSGTKLLFQQNTAPTGWTKSTTHDNKALRIVSGNVTTGGTVAFTIRSSILS